MRETDSLSGYPIKNRYPLSDEDTWFDSNLRCLLGSEIELIKQGKKERIDKRKLADWILKYCPEQG